MGGRMNDLPRMRAAQDQRQQEACNRLFEGPAEFAVLLSLEESAAMDYFRDHHELWKPLFRYARLGFLGTCIAMIDRRDLESENP